MNRLQKEYQLLSEHFTIFEILKAIITGFLFFIFPTLLAIGVLIVLGTIYPYWNMEILLLGSLVIFLYGFWTTGILIETLNQYANIGFPKRSLFALLMQFCLLIAIIIIDIIIITTIF